MAVVGKLKGLIKQYLLKGCDRAYRKRLEEKKGIYQASPITGEAPFDDPAISLVLLVTGGGSIDIQGLRRLARRMAEEGWQMAYGDEDVTRVGRKGSEYAAPWYKPDWSPDTLRSFFYTGAMMLVRGELWSEVCGGENHRCGDDEGKRGGKTEARKTDGIPTFFFEDKGRMYRIVMELAERAGGYERGCRSIGHEPVMVYHGRDEGEQREYLDIPGDPAADDHMEREALREKAAWEENVWKEAAPSVSVIIPSRDNPGILRQCIDALGRGTLLPQIIVVDNGSGEENRRKMKELLGEAEESTGMPTVYLYEPMEFHFSRMCNKGAGRAAGDVLVFLNDDVELTEPAALEQLARRAVLPHAGAVGIKLYYPDSARIQHAGITNLPMGPVHKLQFLEDEGDYYFGRNHKDYNVLAVTGACLGVKADRFWEAGGFPEELPVAFNDVALCFALWEAGWNNVVLNSCHGYHHESFSRGQDEEPEKLARLLRERDRLYEMYKELEGYDPYYPEGLGRTGLDVRIRPAWLTGRNTPTEGRREPVSAGELEEYTPDPCLLVRIEQADASQILGYGVVLGDDNSAYERWLLLLREDGGGYRLPAGEQYRPDLEENMADQVNVALSGFHILLSDIPEGSYRLGMLAKSKVSRIRLRQLTNRRILI